MKIKTLILLFLLTLSLNLSLGVAFASEHEQRVDPTPFVTEYFDKLRVKCNFGVKEFELMREALLENSPRLINPLPKDEALILSNCYPYWDNFERILNKAKNVKLDYEQIITKVDKLINEIKDNEYQREEAHIKTENINIEMDFAVIPAGEYKNYFIGSFAVSPDISIQTTPVTQYQWAKVMGDNPSNFKTGEDSRKVEINGKQIEMCPNKPVESVSYEMITEFIKKLNDQDPIYEYQLPSIEEYLAVIGNHAQTRGYSCLNQKETCHIEFSGYQYLGKQRVYSMLDNVLEFTRNSQERTDCEWLSKSA